MSFNFSDPDILPLSGGILTVDLKALRDNYALIARTVAPARTSAVVKADAYGITLENVAADCGTIAYEKLTSLGPRYQRHYIYKRCREPTHEDHHSRRRRHRRDFCLLSCQSRP
ncbi:hypothetical protein DUT91_02290 [Phyllobacterium salinisoli]|uniref:Alanine racemase N-terminal domain-containing protein n=1 Tax=Phyllobacterium salinisoli TaxID=1899321 RepID=A0A368KB43_9HYPH|nr:hypothetical protein DUT91_02290 [Phyllobacterium salinisoli]